MKPKLNTILLSPSLALALFIAAVVLLAPCRASFAQGGDTNLGAPDPPKLIFAHYMIANTPDDTASHVRVDDYKKEIVYAQAHGIDGFALNCADWTKRQDFYKKRASLMYEAAEDLGTGFKLFISADFCCNIDIDDVRDMVQTFYNHPNQLRIEGKPVLSTYAGSKRSDEIQRLLSSLASQGMPVFFLPNYHIPEDPVTGKISSSDVEGLVQQYPYIGGNFEFGGADTGPQAVAKIDAYSHTLHSHGKLFVAGITPFYRAFRGDYRTYETEGFNAMQMEWKAAINDGADMVELVTWNDWAEGTYLSPDMPQKFNKRTGPLLPHTAYLDASRYYIDWFKSGKAPAITVDRLFYFYRLAPKSVPGAIDPSGKFSSEMSFPKRAETLKDSIFVTLFLTAPADLTVHSGDRSQTFHLDAGVQNVEMPFSTGTQRFLLVRDNRVIIDKEGEEQVSSDNSTDFNYFSGEASAGG